MNSGTTFAKLWPHSSSTRKSRQEFDRTSCVMKSCLSREDSPRHIRTAVGRCALPPLAIRQSSPSWKPYHRRESGARTSAPGYLGTDAQRTTERILTTANLTMIPLLRELKNTWHFVYRRLLAHMISMGRSSIADPEKSVAGVRELCKQVNVFELKGNRGGCQI